MKRLWALASSAALLAVVASPALADSSQLRFGGFVGGARGAPNGGLFTEPADVAIYGGHGRFATKVFVVEAAPEGGRVQRLDSAGNFELAWGRDVVRSGRTDDRGRGYEVCRAQVSGAAGCKTALAGRVPGALRVPTAIAVDEGSEDVYVMDRGNRRIQHYTGDGRFLGGWGIGVVTGRPRFEVCRARCRAGQPGSFEGREIPDVLANPRLGAIAVSPRAPHRVFAGDEGNHRVFEFTSDGMAVRGWGWGVATGSRQFEVCAPADSCRKGRPRPGGGWPRHLEVDARGIVYGSESGRYSDVTRFESQPAPAAADASSNRLAPLTIDDVLSVGFTTGLAVDRASGNLFVYRNGFGPAVIDEIARPGGGEPLGLQHDGLAYLGSVTGIAVLDRHVRVAVSSKLYADDPQGGFDECRLAGKRRPCNGLITLVPSGGGDSDSASVVGLNVGGSSGALTAALSVGPGVLGYEVQVSRDGVAWHRAGGAMRYIGGPGEFYAPASTGRLRSRTAYLVRIVTGRRPYARAPSYLVPVIGGGLEGRTSGP